MPCSEHWASPVVRICYACARIRWLKASLLEPARAREGRGLFATQIRQPSRARCFAIEKQWNTLFYRSSGWCGILCAAPSPSSASTRRLVLEAAERTGSFWRSVSACLCLWIPTNIWSYTITGIQGQQQSEE
ncbi:hypothetical protein [Paenibacillus polymyxa]|uniref:hypothetical protein n=1 Tax=Paenibacillus polymyxa TaxID=1406 RepID=UPI00131A0BC3|nr:hypothetical protein [Paenibacillus polymyxa]